MDRKDKSTLLEFGSNGISFCVAISGIGWALGQEMMELDPLGKG